MELHVSCLVLNKNQCSHLTIENHPNYQNTYPLARELSEAKRKDSRPAQVFPLLSIMTSKIMNARS